VLPASRSASTPSAASASIRWFSPTAPWPNGPDEIAIDTKTASSKQFAVGDLIGVQTRRGRSRSFRVTGLVKFGNVSSLGGATLAIFDLPTAAEAFPQGGQARLDRCRRGRRT